MLVRLRVCGPLNTHNDDDDDIQDNPVDLALELSETLPPSLTSSWPHLRCDVGLEEGEYK